MSRGNNDKNRKKEHKEMAPTRITPHTRSQGK
jgi:hypothetical protein